jgi:CheY-like chemotaxis protein
VSGQSPVVLVVEDDPALRLLYRNTLTLEGYAVVAVDDGISALRFLDGASVPAAVVLDLDLPRLSGCEVQRELMAHAETSHIPIIVVTGNPAGIDPATVACVLAKPIDVNDLIRSIANCLRNGRHRG